MRIFTVITIIIVTSILSGCNNVPRILTEGLYRLPNISGGDVRVNQDDLTQDSPAKNMFDLANVEPEQVLVAAAPGWVRFIDDGNETGGNANNNYVWIEHPLDYCQPPTNGVLGATTSTHCKFCSHGLGKCNGWTLTTHMRKYSVTAEPPLGAELTENDWVKAGQPIGVEGSVGFVMVPNNMRCSDADFINNHFCGRQAHFNLLIFDADALGTSEAPIENDDYSDYANNLPKRQ